MKFNDRLVEIQTANFRSIRYKLLDLLSDHAVTLVYPIAVEKWLVKKTKDGESRRKSPRTGRATDVLDELIYVPKLLNHPNLTLELVYVHIEEHREFDPKRAWRRRHWVVTRRALIAIKGFDRFQDMGALFEKFTATLNHPFTTHSIARDLRISRSQAQRFAYCFRHAGVIGQCGKEGNAVIYQRQANFPT